LRAQGFTVSLLARIVRAELAVARPEIVKAGGRTLSMLRLTITDTGRRAIAGMQLARGQRVMTMPVRAENSPSSNRKSQCKRPPGSKPAALYR
jgi:hypothetical protein